MQVWWYPLSPVTKYRDLSLPKGAKPLSVAMRQGLPVLYVLVERGTFPQTYTVTTVGTGMEFIPTNHRYLNFRFVGTFEYPTDYFWHVFMDGE